MNYHQYLKNYTKQRRCYMSKILKTVGVEALKNSSDCYLLGKSPSGISVRFGQQVRDLLRLGVGPVDQNHWQNYLNFVLTCLKEQSDENYPQ